MITSFTRAIVLMGCLLLAIEASFAAEQSDADRKILADLRSGAEKGEAKAQHELGMAYFRGELGITNDYTEAARLVRKAADQNYPKAQSNMGMFYRTGQGVANDEVEAVKWFRKAADQNDPEAQNSLGGCYLNGVGVEKDYVEAYKWISLAGDQGEEKARKFMPQFEGGMKREQIEEGRKRARNFKPTEKSP